MRKDKTQRAAAVMAQKRWAEISPKERSKQMKAIRAFRSDAPGGVGVGGRPRSKDRCYCGARSRHSAELRYFDCCKRAGKYPTGKALSKELKGKPSPRKG